MTIPVHDAGVGFKAAHFEAIRHCQAAGDPSLPAWFEVHPENYFGAGGVPHRQLDWLRGHFPIALHGVGLSLGGAEGLDSRHLERLRTLVAGYQPMLLSEHLAWSHWRGNSFNDLLPIPYHEASLATVCRNVQQVQEATGRQILVENPSRYLAFQLDTMSEPEFLNRLATATGCGVLLDINNIHVSACNLGLSAEDYLGEIDIRHIGEIHLAGHTCETLKTGERLLIDDHGSPTCAEVWELYESLLRRMPEPPPALIEWDTDIPDFPVLLDEVARERRLRAAAEAYRDAG